MRCLPSPGRVVLFLLVLCIESCFGVSAFLPPTKYQRRSPTCRSHHLWRSSAKVGRPREDSLNNLPPPAVMKSTTSQVTELPPFQQENEASKKKEKPEWVPKTVNEALQTFFSSAGPLIVSLTQVYLLVWRMSLSALSLVDLEVFAGTIIFWSFQEHFLHQRLLHSKWNWYGKEIHQGHHEKPYFHISIDPAPLMLAWMGTVHLILRYLLPLPIAITATLGYSAAGLFYEYCHFIVHTKVINSSSQKFWRIIRDNHMRHHCVDDRYWFAFSLTVIDDLFGTNPPLAQVRERKRKEKMAAKTAAENK